MNVNVSSDAKQLGREAADFSVNHLKRIIDGRGYARVVLATGASQFDMLEALVKSDIDWRKVEMFHLDEYVALSEEHPASFRKYLKERFLERVSTGKAHLIDGDPGKLEKTLANLTAEIRKGPIDLAMIGIGENAHIAFNDPPADFDTKEAYKVVDLDDACKRQQVGEGWFPDIDAVPAQAISMTVHQIMQCRTIVSCVPHAVKAKAIQATFAGTVTNLAPSSILTQHPDWHLYLDVNSASLLNR